MVDGWLVGKLVGSTLIIVLKLLTGIELGNYFVHIFSGRMLRMLTVNGKLVDIETCFLIRQVPTQILVT